MALVVLFHANVSWASGGYLGVDVFFVLSGFLITRLLLEERHEQGRIALGRFYVRRGLRLFPALAVVSLAVAVYAVGWLPPDQTSRAWSDIALTATYRMNWAQALSARPPYGLLDHAWSLSIEEQFYAIWPVVLMVAHRLGRRCAVLVVSVVTMATSAILRGVMWNGGTPAYRVYHGLDTHSDALLLGCALATATLLWPSLSEVVTRRSGRWLGAAALVTVAAIGAKVGIETAGLYSWIYPAFAVAAGIAVFDIWAGGITTTFLGAAPLVALGRISYGLYLWHWPVFLVLNADRTHWGFLTLTLARLALSLGVSIATFFLVEQPFLRLKRHLGPAGRFSEPTFDLQVPSG